MLEEVSASFGSTEEHLVERRECWLKWKEKNRFIRWARVLGGVGTGTAFPLAAETGGKTSGSHRPVRLENSGQKLAAGEWPPHHNTAAGSNGNGRPMTPATTTSCRGDDRLVYIFVYQTLIMGNAWGAQDKHIVWHLWLEWTAATRGSGHSEWRGRCSCTPGSDLLHHHLARLWLTSPSPYAAAAMWTNTTSQEDPRKSNIQIILHQQRCIY